MAQYIHAADELNKNKTGPDHKTIQEPFIKRVVKQMGFKQSKQIQVLVTKNFSGPRMIESWSL